MNAPITKGYDAAQGRRDEDDLDRWRFAAEIVEVVLATPPDWSARLGIFGKWGEGKSTVLRFAERMLKDKKSIVFAFNPWAVQNWDDLWEDFGTRLSEALSEAGVPFEGSWKKAAKNSGHWIEGTGVGPLAEGALALVRADKLYNAAFGALRRWLRYDGDQIRVIREKLGGRRLVVLIDDLDRCDPKLIPQLLLSLRELLDLPGFTFLLAFDDEIVGRSLIGQNPAWGDGSSFLEKILDFRFHLPRITEEQKERLIYRAIARYCPFVPKESVTKIQDLLPNNPRRLKALIRSLVALQPQLVRHDEDELNWVDMWLAQMLRLESYPFFERLLTGETLDKEVGAYFQVLVAREKKGEQRNESLRQLIKDVGVDNSLTSDRLVELIEAVRSRSSSLFRYVCELAVRPPAVTWKEFRSFYAKWMADRQASVVSSWIQQHAKERDVPSEDVERELFEAIITRRNGCLSSAAESASMEEHDSFTDEALRLLELVEQDLIGLGKLDGARFAKLYGQASYWIGFRKNPSDKTLRGAEEATLLKLLSFASEGLSTELFEVVVPQHWTLDLGEGTGEKRVLRQKCLDIVEPKAAKEAITFITRDGGIRSLSEAGRFPAVKYCLFNLKSTVWTTGLRDNLLELVRSGRNNLTIYANLRDLFHLLVRGLQYGIDSVNNQDVAALLSDETFVRCLWDTLTSRGIQYRMQMSFIEGRQRLIQNGTPEAALPLTDDLQLRVKEEDSRRAGRQAQTSPGTTDPGSRGDAPSATPKPE